MAFKDKNEKDDFWDIDKLVPRKKSSLSPFASQDPVRDYTPPEPRADAVVTTSSERSADERSLSFSDRGQKRVSESETYYPEGHSLIRSVTVHHFIDKYDFYDNFRKTALIYFDYRPTARYDFVDFYSYQPQYSQLTPEQKNYYFYWRGELQRGRYIRSNSSYIRLYISEVLNLPDKIPPAEGILILCRLWREYRRQFPMLDSYLAAWICDYCLVHRLHLPIEELESFLPDVIAISSFKEFYLSGIEHAPSKIGAILSYLSDYDYRKSKYIDGDPEHSEEKRKEEAELFRKHIEGAMSLLLSDLWGECVDECRTGMPEKKRYDAFIGAVCTHKVKRKLEVEYYRIDKAEGLHRGVTAAVRYAENKIRALLGIKGRLSVKDLPTDYRSLIDYYFDAINKRAEKERQRASAPEYERLYDAPDEKMSSEGADEIERASWSTTMRLVEASDEEIPEALIPTEQIAEPECRAELSVEPQSSSDTEDNPDGYGLGDEELGYISMLLGIGESGSVVGGFDEAAIVERINEAFSDGFGDVIIEETPDGYTIIEDYREDITEWLLRLMK